MLDLWFSTTGRTIGWNCDGTVRHPVASVIQVPTSNLDIRRNQLQMVSDTCVALHDSEEILLYSYVTLVVITMYGKRQDVNPNTMYL